MDNDKKINGSEERVQSQTRSTRLVSKKQKFQVIGERLRLEDFDKGDYGINQSKVRPSGKSGEHDVIIEREDSFLQEPRGLISLTPLTGSMYVQPDELQLEKQRTSQQSTKANVASKLFGILLFTAALVIYSFQTLMIKIVQKNNRISPQELLYYFSIVTFILSYATTKVYKEDLTQLEPSTYKAVVGRFITGYFSDIFLFVAYVYTSYSKSQCIFFMNTLMIPLFARCMLNEKIKKVDVVAIFISFIGMILIIQPFKGNDVSQAEMTSDLIGIAFALFGAANGALSVIYNKQAASKVHHSKMTTYYTAANIVFSPIWSFFQQRDDYPIYDWTLLFYILAIGVAFWAMQMLMTKSFSIITAGMAGILIYIAVPIGYILDYLFLHTHIGALEIVGVCIIVGTNVMIGILLYFGYIS